MTTKTYTEYDHNDPNITLESTYETWDQLRLQGPIGKSDAYGGMWVVTGYKEAYDILHKPEIFSSWPTSIPPFPNPTPMVPVEIDPPDLLRYRALLAEPFSPRRVKQYTEPLRETVNSLIDQFVEDGSCDICETMATPLPTFLGTTMLGLPLSDAPKLQEWVHTFVHESASNPEKAGLAAIEIFTYFGELLAERKQDSSGEDLITLMAHSEIDGERLSDDDLLGFCLFLLLAAIDTSQKVIGSIFWHLGTDPELRARLVSNPDQIPAAVEEFLRFYGPVITARTAMEDVTIGGVDMKTGDRILVLLGAANRDENEFPEAAQYIIDRTANRHVTFGGHAHRCLGSHIARAEINIMLEEFLSRIPNYTIADESMVEWASGQTQGVVRLPIEFPAGNRLESHS